MPKPLLLTKTFHIIIERMIATGQAPNYTEIAAELGVSTSEGRKTLRKLFSTLGFPGWFSRKTDDIESFAPFSNSSNYRLTIEGEQKLKKMHDFRQKSMAVYTDRTDGLSCIYKYRKIYLLVYGISVFIGL